LLAPALNACKVAVKKLTIPVNMDEIFMKEFRNEINIMRCHFSLSLSGLRLCTRVSLCTDAFQTGPPSERAAIPRRFVGPSGPVYRHGVHAKGLVVPHPSLHPTPGLDPAQVYR
jgi:hypothetical protein